MRTSEKRALFLCPSPFGIGTYHRAIAFARHLVRYEGYAVDLLCTGPTDEVEMVQGVRVVRTSPQGPSPLPMPGWNPGEVWKRLRFIRASRHRYSLVYSFEYQPTVWPLARYVAWRDRAAHFNDWCDWYAGRHHQMKGIRVLQALDARLEERPRSRVDGLTVICGSLRDRALGCGVSPEKLLLVREGAEVHGAWVTRSEARRQLGVSESDFIVFGMAESRHALAQKAIHLLAEVRPEARLVIVGKVRDISEDAHTKLPGRVSEEELHLWLCAADCAWLPLEPSLVNEGRLPHKIGHFRIYGLPTLTTTASEAPSLGDPGIHVADYSAEAFARATQGFAPLTDAARKDSRAEAAPIFDWDQVLGPWLERLRTELGRDARPPGG